MDIRCLIGSCMVAGLTLVLPGSAFGQTGYAISGGLSNFDCTNHCDHPCDELEVEIEGIHPEDVVHTYYNSNYHAPTVTLKDDGTATIISYRHPQHLTAVGSIEHFGISLRQFSWNNPIRVRWMLGGAPATVNGQVPLPGGGSAPATQPIMPGIAADKGISFEGDTVISVSVTNNDPFQAIWVRRSAQITSGSVGLEALMTNNPVVTTSLVIDSTPVLLPAGGTLTLDADMIELEGDQSIVVAAKYFQNLTVGGPFGGQGDTLGPELGNVMTATIASPESVCGENTPIIISQPASVTADAGAHVRLIVDVQGDDLPHTFQWMKEGVPLVASDLFDGVHGDELDITELNSATEGFYSVSVVNACGTAVSQSALVFITGHNEPPQRVGGGTGGATPCNVADITDIGDTGAGADAQLTVDDVIVFVNWFSDGTGCPGDVPCNVADITDIGDSGAGADGQLTVDDVIAFFNAFGDGC